MILRYLRLVGAFFRYSITRELMFKTNVFLWIIVELAWFGIQLSFVEVIYSHVTMVAGWNKYQMILLIGTNHLIQQLFQFTFLTNCMDLSENIRTGKLDFILLRPANSQFLISIQKFDCGALVNGSVALGLVVYASLKLNLHPSMAQILLYSALLLNGMIIHYVLLFALVTLSFWIVRAQGLVYGYYNLFQIARIPQEAFKGGIKFLFTMVLPMLVVANYPASVLGRGLWGIGVLWVFGLSSVMMILVSFWFRFALRHYRSASS